MAHDSIVSLLPLPTTTLHILLALASEDRHGYAIMGEVERQTGGRLRLGAGTLYRSLQRLSEQGLVEETSTRPAPDQDDERRRYYRITRWGETAVRAEIQRLSELVRLARQRGLAGERA